MCGKGTKMGSGELWGHVSDALPALGVLPGVAAGTVPVAVVFGVTLLSLAPSNLHLWRVPSSGSLSTGFCAEHDSRSCAGGGVGSAHLVLYICS